MGVGYPLDIVVCSALGVELSRLELDRVYRAMIELADRESSCFTV